MNGKEDAWWLVAELDFGRSPEGMLVIREARWPRVVGIILGLLVGIPASWAATVFAVGEDDLGAMLTVSVFAGLALGGAVWLFYDLLNSNCYYVAADNERLFLRRGPRRLTILPLAELREFEASQKVLYVRHQPSDKRTTVMKNAYAPENVALLARRLNVWRHAPPEIREPALRELDVIDRAAMRAAANRQIARSLSILCLYPILIVVSANLPLLRAPVVSIVLWSLYILGAVRGLVGGIARRVGARPKSAHCRRPDSWAQPETAGRDEGIGGDSRIEDLAR